MAYYLAHVTAPSGNKWYELVKATTPNEAREKVWNHFGDEYNVEISEAIE